MCCCPALYQKAITPQDYQLKCELIQDEGCWTVVYCDSLGNPTVGIGHLIKPTDPPSVWNLKPENSITNELIKRLYETDGATAINDCRNFFSNLGNLPREAQRILAKMSFNLGRYCLSKFRNLIRAVKTETGVVLLQK